MAEGSTSINDCSVTVSGEGKEKEECINSWGCCWYVENGGSTLQSCDVCPAGSTDGLKCPLNSQSNEGAFKKSECYIDSSNKISDSTGAYNLSGKYFYRLTPQEVIEEGLIVPLEWPQYDACMDIPLPSC